MHGLEFGKKINVSNGMYNTLESKIIEFRKLGKNKINKK